MELLSFVGTLALALSTAGVEGMAAGDHQPLPEPISTGQALFSIPFQVEASQLSEHEPTEVQLHVSVDRGATWHLYSKVEPKRGYFLFRAGGDGEFWFLIRTLDRAGQLRPQQTSRPGLRVIVDTTPPKLALEAQRGDAGQVTARWQVDDPNCDLQTLKIQYRTSPNPAWQFVAVDHQNAGREGAVCRGEVTWWVPSDVARVEVRAEVADTAGNPTVTHAQVGLEEPPVVSEGDSPSFAARKWGQSSSASPSAAEGDSPVFAARKPGQSPSASPSGAAATGATPAQGTMGQEASDSRMAAGSALPEWRPSTDPPASPAWEGQAAGAQPEPGALTGIEPSAKQDPPQAARRVYTIPPSRYAERPVPYSPDRYSAAPQVGRRTPGVTPLGDRSASDQDAADAAPYAGQPAAASDTSGYGDQRPATASQGLPNSDDVVALPGPTQGSVAIHIHPPIANQFAPPKSESAGAGSWGVPSGETVRVVHSRVFELEYDVESVGPSGIARVELWGTLDKGRTWSSFGIDDDNKSPLLVTVPEEGLYGFRVAVRNGAGLGGKKPRSTDKPEVWIAVDQTKPSAQILNTEQSGVGQAGQLIIRWKADDRMLADRPISLFFSDTVGGPWSPIANDLENTGEYAWSLDSRVPQRVYLRLEVRDRAGNLGISETSTAVSLDQLRPVVRIRDVRPLDRSAQAPRVYSR